MKTKIIQILQQKIINVLTSTSDTDAILQHATAFNGIKLNGIMHKALTAHLASTHPHYINGIPATNRIDVIPLRIKPQPFNSTPAIAFINSHHESIQLPAMLQQQAF